jgi:hypothetical protein
MRATIASQLLICLRRVRNSALDHTKPDLRRSDECAQHGDRQTKAKQASNRTIDSVKIGTRFSTI